MSGWLSLAITVILVVVAYVILNRTITNRTSQQTALDDIKREVGAIITELNSTTERNIELIEDRIHSLERLIEQADKRVSVLRRDLVIRDQSKTGGEPTTYSRLASARRPEVRSSPGEHERGGGNEPPRGNESAGDRDDRDEAARGAAPSPGAGPHDSFYVSRGGGIHQESQEPSPRERIRMLYLRGVSLERIASIVGKTVGEVELIVSLDEGT
ncbi:MAG: hypothetical protein ACOC1I_08970, partial [Spirochaetota bacterium]